MSADVARIEACLNAGKLGERSAARWARILARLTADPLHGLTHDERASLRDAERVCGIATTGRPTNAERRARVPDLVHEKRPPELSPWLLGTRPPTLRDAEKAAPWLRAFALILSWIPKQAPAKEAA